MGLYWHPWTSVSDGRSTPGAPITACRWEDSSALFISDPSGGIYAIKATPGFGWEIGAGTQHHAGAPITALLSGNLFTSVYGRRQRRDIHDLRNPLSSWQSLDLRVEGSSTPGAPIAAIPWEGQLCRVYFRS